MKTRNNAVCGLLRKLFPLKTSLIPKIMTFMTVIHPVNSARNVQKDNFAFRASNKVTK